MQDNDGIYPLQLLCSCCARAPDESGLLVGLESIHQADNKAVQRLDFGDASALHTLLVLTGVEKKGPPLHALKFLLSAQADPTSEDESGFTAVHHAAAVGGENGEAMLAALREAPMATPEFWATLNIGKQRDTSNRKYLARRGGHHRIPLEDRLAVLGGDVSIAGIAKRIATGGCRHVVALVGAGASTAAGIPDFRSPMGLWSQSATRDLFSADGFAARPQEFWRTASKLFLGRRPTKVHALLACLASNGILRRVYTQNVDGLEKAAGVPAHAIVECHGSALHAVCSADFSHHVDLQPAKFMEKLEFADDRWSAPRCSCGALLRPDIVFFGEPLPEDFALKSGEDMSACDLLIVVGTALSVYPVAGLVSRVGQLTPRLLINREPVGVWKSASTCGENYRDVMWQGDCDTGAEEIARLLGWDLTPGHFESLQHP
eukprot:gnl/TRDRNA2_/TRDRNA2_161408_c0_seq1.p1 gnl/TRDRNA2_/TRDRNA2_161408_c0~~gnl/TRDRNA2_/TRDRNA2_161408_c0_seq1.p1  ORF type:complete len:476 (-),score=54.83 gnl/TRDRNA2_/TRDRNA2_161408_c0_seq1:201-1499(-)